LFSRSANRLADGTTGSDECVNRLHPDGDFQIFLFFFFIFPCFLKWRIQDIKLAARHAIIGLILLSLLNLLFFLSPFRLHMLIIVIYVYYSLALEKGKKGKKKERKRI
jgi:hypothetical protein